MCSCLNINSTVIISKEQMYEYLEPTNLAEMSSTAILGIWYWFIDSSHALATAVNGVSVPED